jgi:hypothetical protein
MEELIKLREFCFTEQEKAIVDFKKLIQKQNLNHFYTWYVSRGQAFSEVIEQLDLILNNSCVKPLDSRSPEGQGYQVGVSRPTERQNPQEDFLDCECDVNTICDNCQKI